MKRKKPSRAPTQNTLDILAKRGWDRQSVQHYNAFAGVFQDLFGCIDILAMREDVSGLVGIQVTTADNKVSHIKKAIESKKVYTWLKTGNYFILAVWELIPWSQTKKWVCQWYSMDLWNYTQGTVTEYYMDYADLEERVFRKVTPPQPEEPKLPPLATTALQ